MKKEKKILTEAQVEKRQARIDTAKSFIFPTILCAIIAAFVIFVINYVNPVEVSEPVKPNAYAGDGAPITLESDGLLFTMDPTTTQFTVKQKATGKEWSSYIADAESDSVALENEKGRMQSNVYLSYSVTTGLETVYDSKSFSVDKGIYDIQQDGDTVKVFYSMGDVKKDFTIPKVIKATDYDALMAQLDDANAKIFKKFYKQYKTGKLKDNEKEELLATYPILETESIYVLRDNISEVKSKALEEGLAAAGYTYEQYQKDLELKATETTNDTPLINMEMDFKLEGNDLLVSIPFSSFEYDKSTPVYSVTPLPYFGSAGADAEGFLFVPEGGGALINYNNGKVSQNDYFANVYGWDMDLRRDYVIHNTRAYFNVFGQSCDDSSYICILEDGSSYASVRAAISGRTNSYNYVDAQYALCSREKYDIGEIANSDVYAYLPELPQDESIVQRYRFVDKGDYVSMAKAYRSYLEEQYGDYMTLNTDTSAPASVELVGAIDKVQQILGVPVSRPLKMTSFNDAASIIQDLNDNGMKNLDVKLTGWANGGVNQKILAKVKPVSQLGSKKDLQNLSDTAKNLGVNLYLDGITQYEHNSNIFNGFFSYRDAAKLLTSERAELFNFSHITYKAREGWKSYYLLHTPLAMKMAQNLDNAAQKYGAGVSYQDIGMDLSSDFYEKDTYSREKTKKANTEFLKSLDQQKVMINMGNDYAVPYVDVVTNMDLAGSEYTILDEAVPFYQIAIHGYVDYTGQPINICGDDQEELLHCVEYGAGLNFTLMSESSFVLQKTLYPEYYGCEYAIWKDRMLSMYNRYNEELGATFNEEITGHESLSPDVKCTTYADGTKVYVNYSFSESFTAPDGTKVSPRDYTVSK